MYFFEEEEELQWMKFMLIDNIRQTLRLFLKYWMNVKPEIKSSIVLDIRLSNPLFTFFQFIQFFFIAKWLGTAGPESTLWNSWCVGIIIKEKMATFFKESCRDRWIPVKTLCKWSSPAPAHGETVAFLLLPLTQHEEQWLFCSLSGPSLQLCNQLQSPRGGVALSQGVYETYLGQSR